MNRQVLSRGLGPPRSNLASGAPLMIFPLHPTVLPFQAFLTTSFSLPPSDLFFPLFLCSSRVGIPFFRIAFRRGRAFLSASSHLDIQGSDFLIPWGVRVYAFPDCAVQLQCFLLSLRFFNGLCLLRVEFFPDQPHPAVFLSCRGRRYEQHLSPRGRSPYLEVTLRSATIFPSPPRQQKLLFDPWFFCFSKNRQSVPSL